MGRSGPRTDRSLSKKERRRNCRSAFQFHRQRRPRSLYAAGADPDSGACSRRPRARVQKTAQVVFNWAILPYEKQQRGRLREHYQLNCDIIGESDFAADIELIALCIDILCGFGLTEKDFVVRISDSDFWKDFLQV